MKTDNNQARNDKKHVVTLTNWGSQGRYNGPNLADPEIRAVLGNNNEKVSIIESPEKELRAYLFDNEKDAEEFDRLVRLDGANSRINQYTLEETIRELKDFDKECKNFILIEKLKKVGLIGFYASFTLPLAYGIMKGMTNQNTPLTNECLDSILFYSQRTAPIVASAGMGLRGIIGLEKGTSGCGTKGAFKKGSWVIVTPIAGTIGYGLALGLYHTGHFLGSLFR